MKQKVKHLLHKNPFRRVKPEESLEQALKGLPRITNETVAEHREEVLSSARKYIYPLKHSAHRVVIISVSLVVTVAVVLFAYCLVALYRFHSTSSFVYRMTQVIPFPIAKVGSQYVAYENYLFELRHYIHYYQTQQQVDFSGAGRQQLANYEKQALTQVIDDAYVKQIAAQHHITVSDTDVNNEITLVRDQDRLGSNNRVFEDVLNEFWGWSLNDFKRELKQEMLAQKVVSTLDTATNQQAQSVYNQLKAGADFGTLAKQYSQDAATSGNGGAYGYAIDPNNTNLSPQIIAALTSLKPGGISGIINTGTTLEIVKLDSVSGNTLLASHISFNFTSINTYINPLMAKEKPKTLITL